MKRLSLISCMCQFFFLALFCLPFTANADTPPANIIIDDELAELLRNDPHEKFFYDEKFLHDIKTRHISVMADSLWANRFGINLKFDLDKPAYRFVPQYVKNKILEKLSSVEQFPPQEYAFPMMTNGETLGNVFENVFGMEILNISLVGALPWGETYLYREGKGAIYKGIQKNITFGQSIAESIVFSAWDEAVRNGGFVSADDVRSYAPYTDNNKKVFDTLKQQGIIDYQIKNGQFEITTFGLRTRYINDMRSLGIDSDEIFGVYGLGNNAIIDHNTSNSVDKTNMKKGEEYKFRESMKEIEVLTADHVQRMTGLTISQMKAILNSPDPFQAFIKDGGKYRDLTLKIVKKAGEHIRVIHQNEIMDNIAILPVLSLHKTPDYEHHLKIQKEVNQTFAKFHRLLETSINKLYSELAVELDQEFQKSTHKMRVFSLDPLYADIMYAIENPKALGYHPEIKSVIDIYSHMIGKDPEDLNKYKYEEVKDTLEFKLAEYLFQFYDGTHPSKDSNRHILSFLVRSLFNNQRLREAIIKKESLEAFMQKKEAYFEKRRQIQSHAKAIRRKSLELHSLKDLVDRGVLQTELVNNPFAAYLDTNGEMPNGLFFFAKSEADNPNWQIALTETNPSNHIVGANYFYNDYVFGFASEIKKSSFSANTDLVSEEKYKYATYFGYTKDDFEFFTSFSFDQGNELYQIGQGTHSTYSKKQSLPTETIRFQMNVDNDFDLGDGFQLTPFANLLYSQHKVGGYVVDKKYRFKFSDAEFEDVYLSAGFTLAYKESFETYDLTVKVGGEYMFNAISNISSDPTLINGKSHSLTDKGLGDGQTVFANIELDFVEFSGKLGLHYEASTFEHADVEHNLLANLKFQF